MSFEEKIKTTSSPTAAMLVLAQGIDEVLARLNQQPAADAWGEWSFDDGGSAGAPNGSAFNDNGQATARPVVDNSAAIAALEQVLLTETDPEDRAAMEARLRLLKDEGASIDTKPPAGVMAEMEEHGDTVVTHLPTPHPERQEARRAWARSVSMWEFSNLPEDEFVEAFAKGGPLWMYHTARDEVMAMPEFWRREFVEDIQLDSPRTAQEVARDILKDADPTGTEASAKTMLTPGNA